MAITVKHKFVSAIPDGTDTTIVRPSNWNDDHDLVGTVPVANGGTGATTLTGYVKGNGTTAMTAATTIPNTDITGLGTASTKDAGVANGVATLDSSGTVPLSQIPALGDLNYQGTWNATTNSPTLTSSVGTKGFYYVVSVAGTTNLNGITDWQIGDWAVYNGSAWQKIDNTDAVTSVNGYTGTVVLTAADVSAVPYTGATGAVDLNAKTLVNVSNLGVNTNTVPTIRVRVVGDNNSTSRIAMRGYSSDANSSSIRVSKFRGTVAAPQAPISGDSLGKFELAGYGTTSADAYPQVSLEGVTTEVWGATARGAKAVVKVTPNTTITQVTALTINQDSTAVFANTVTANGTLLTGNTGTVTSVAATAGTGITVSGSPITTSGTLTITNSAPDQTVVLTAGTGISTSGTYPNFTITNTSPSSGGTVTSVAALTLGTTGTDLSSSVATGTTTPVITLNVPTASASNRGALSSADWTTFNGKQAALVSGTNIKTVNGTTLLGSGDLGTITYAYGGTGQTTVTTGDLLYGSATNTWSKLGIGTTGQILRVVSGAPAWGTDYTGTVTSVGGTGTVNGLTLTGTVTTSGNLTLGGTLDLSSPPAIGGTAAAAITGTTITATKFVGVSGGTF